MLDQVFETDDGFLNFDDAILRELADVFEVPVLFVGVHWVIGGQILQLVIVSKQLLIDVFSDVFPLLVDVGCNAAQEWRY